MAYSCAVFPTADTSLDDAQAENVGAGWGGLVRYAAAHTESKRSA
jgi:cyclopropane fatty-acyl-phospholipid synthase-like methyltransferase